MAVSMNTGGGTLLARLLGQLDQSGPPKDLAAEARYGVHGDVPASLQRPVKPRPAAVLIPIVAHEQEPTILLTRRTDHLADHPGQICFPGGGCEVGDPDLEATALRETREEVGIDADRIHIRGYLRPYMTITGFAVAPVVGLLQPGFAVAPDPFEVAEVFEVPLAHLMDPANHAQQQADFRGHTLSYYQIDWRGYRVWGATAAMLVGMSQILEEDGT
ncbi:8-oxo-dGTP pyrophosphatase MutT (NUDIX family) [Natronospira proteinivora]|uniref:8-oxo-dGTP pyrophosphatase MutT (NUDIX family) n=1 Tax=Natronospira proteinivora TaxID=1807133 RepID=A0ABT1G6B5_9GAMM|nr:CoA pyrophosphatase [Natronospira proteinivora]MCP1726796.1 8-oxo-dGTP pyrophosphatase MutT (NUDIX family) [Natronospira proteinivora]